MFKFKKLAVRDSLGRFSSKIKGNSHDIHLYTMNIVISVLFLTGFILGIQTKMWWIAMDRHPQTPIVVDINKGNTALYISKWRGFIDSKPWNRNEVVLTGYVIPKSVEVKSKLTLNELIAKSKYPTDLDNIHNLETSRGLNSDPNALHNYCKSIGKTNEFGYGGMQSKMCFDTYEESIAAVTSWLDDRRAETYCYYNQGKRITDCKYALNAKL